MLKYIFEVSQKCRLEYAFPISLEGIFTHGLPISGMELTEWFSLRLDSEGAPMSISTKKKRESNPL